MKRNLIEIRIRAVWLFMILASAGNLCGQTGSGTMPQIVSKDGHHALLIDGKPFFMLGGQAHNSSGWR